MYFIIRSVQIFLSEAYENIVFHKKQNEIIAKIRVYGYCLELHFQQWLKSVANILLWFVLTHILGSILK